MSVPLRKLSALVLLGFASGIPFNLTADTLQAWLTGAGVSLTTVGALNAVRLPYSLKFLWSPLVDRFRPPLLGRRRGWVAASQLGLAAALVAMAALDPVGQLQWMTLLAIGIALLSATQDIAFDAYRTDVLDPEEYGNGAAAAVLGYRIALLLTGAFCFRLAEWFGWPVVYLAMAALMLVGVAVSATAPEPPEPPPPPNLFAAVRQPLAEFFSRRGTLQALTILLFIVLYRLSDTLAAAIAVPFLKIVGFSLAEIGDIRGGVGFAATTLGVVAGGALLARLGINRALWVFGILQAASNLGYFALALTGKQLWLFAAVVTVENGCGGLGTAAFVAFLMSLCDERYSATQYALLSSLMAVGGTLLGSTTGVLAEAVGWPVFFALTVAAALPGLLLLPRFAPWKSPLRPAASAPLQ